MDNHRAAWWCWMQQLSPEESIDVFHIDRHTDTLPSNLEIWTRHLPQQMRGKSLDDYLGLECLMNGSKGPVIR
ncbi:UPF0489 family protein [Paraburkholderia sp. XV]|uniref:UPF0489 family protein n=1 Tax=Paraburkholderia sp. XV TaxID=2831520 RepID=UPI001CD629F4